MPFNSINDPKLPIYVKSRTSAIRQKWITIFNSVYAKEGEKVAFVIANEWLKEQLVKRTSHISRNEKLIMKKVVGGLTKRANGTYTVDFVLTDNMPDSLGLKMSMPLLEKWAKQINSGLLRFVGDKNHEEFDVVDQAGIEADEAIKIIRERKTGFAEGVKAFIKNGKLWVRAIVDSAARHIVDQATGVSVEANLNIDELTNTAIDGELGGFTFAVGTRPINPRSTIKK